MRKTVGAIILVAAICAVLVGLILLLWAAYTGRYDILPFSAKTIIAGLVLKFAGMITYGPGEARGRT